jgi:hypothetical protein
VSFLNWLRTLLGRPVRHYDASWDGYNATCACGFHSQWDYNLRNHFAEQERVGK